ncbi:hypothetical protein GCM10010471_05130 [Leucobacter komagatae]
MPLAHGQRAREPGDPDCVDSPVADAADGAGDEVAAVIPIPAPGKRVWAAALARAEPGSDAGGRAREEPAILRLWLARRARRSAVNAGARDAEVETPIPPPVAARGCAIARVEAEWEGWRGGGHGNILPRAAGPGTRKSDTAVGYAARTRLCA